MNLLSFSILLALFITWSIASPNPLGVGYRAAPENTVVINNAHTDVGDSEYPGGTSVYCTSSARTSAAQGTIPEDFWNNVAYNTGIGSGSYVQLTGCINPSSLDRINTGDAGGQYDSSGGRDGTGNPAGSVCAGYNHYIEILEPAGPRACIRCCEDPDDCPTKQDRSGCPNVIPGDYFDCP
ncbi:hypothetical protein BDN70DRAFT_909004 [Pholiota conissans]|uniref:Uncharacterized protein n=1 Tax=Pholiota conissans TaxID=109636 RepID=A0A9P5YPB5_9AGAR|nr:hypothetical protein BDN70DRAFT_909004 [Pholiota conissans]